MSNDAKRDATELAAFIDANPSPFHVVEEVSQRLIRHGFNPLDESATWSLAPGRYFVRRGGSLVAWVLPEEATAALGFRVVAAHTDSPNLRIKPRPDSGRAGHAQLGVEVYGAPLLNSWLDRDLGLSGRAFVRAEHGPEERLFLIGRPVLRIPQLAIHLDRDVNEKGLKLDEQQHLAPTWGLGTDEDGFRHTLAEEVGVDPDDLLSWDAMCHDTQPATLLGGDTEFLSAPRIDNLCSCFCALQGLVARLARGEALRHVPVIALFDHEEVGSTSRTGAQSPLLRDLLERTVIARGGSREDYHRAIAGSACVSADMAHATHPNYVERHEPEHHLHLNAGPVIKVNANQRYATEGATEALFQTACERADVPYQKWVNRSDLACGSTIGPLTASNLGLPTVDVGTAQLAMHSARELCGALDPTFLARALAAFWE